MYDAHGNLTSGSQGGCPFLYAVQYTETSLYYLRARYYDPSSAQFLTRDPMVSVTREPYAYVLGDPLNGTDPTGLDCGFLGLGCVAQAIQSVANAFVNSDVGKVANGWANGVTFGLSSDVQGMSSTGAAKLAADKGSGWWTAGNIAGDLTATVLAPLAISRYGGMALRACTGSSEISIGTSGTRISPFGQWGAVGEGGQGANWAARLPHYHQRLLDDAGNVIEGQGISWHRPWEP